MTARKKTRSRETSAARVHGRDLPLRNHAERALSDYFTSLNGHRPAHLYDLVLREVEEPLFRVVLDYAEGNQSRAAGILGINRGTLRKKLKHRLGYDPIDSKRYLGYCLEKLPTPAACAKAAPAPSQWTISWPQGW